MNPFGSFIQFPGAFKCNTFSVMTKNLLTRNFAVHGPWPYGKAHSLAKSNSDISDKTRGSAKRILEHEQRHFYFTAPATTPLIICFCNTTYKINIGTTHSKSPAIIVP